MATNPTFLISWPCPVNFPFLALVQFSGCKAPKLVASNQMPAQCPSFHSHVGDRSWPILNLRWWISALLVYQKYQHIYIYDFFLGIICQNVKLLCLKKIIKWTLRFDEYDQDDCKTSFNFRIWNVEALLSCNLNKALSVER